MKKTRGLGPWMFAALITAAVASPGLGRKGATGTARAQTESATAQASAPGATAGDDDGIDTLDTVAESLAVDTTTAGLKRRTLWSLRALRPQGEAALPLPAVSPQQLNAIDYLDAFFALPLRDTKEAGLGPARAALGLLKKAYVAGAAPLDTRAHIMTAAADIDRFLTGYFDAYALSDKAATKADVLLARNFEELDKNPLKLVVLSQTVESRKNHVDFLIATLPDPIDSFTGWQFDPMLDAISQAIAASDYVLDRFHFPDSDKEAGGSAGTPDRGRLHELEPGVIVFRNYVKDVEWRRDDDGEWRRDNYGDRLVLLIVHENPAAGIHARALANALRLVARCNTLAHDPNTIRILGPTFSGSSESLNRALRLAERNLDHAFKVRIVSGSATDSMNKNTIENVARGTSPKLQATFKATVHPDDALLPSLVNQLTDAGWSKQIGVLFESNTQYGREMGDALWQQHLTARDPISLIRLPFPMNISRLRSTVESDDATQTAPLGLPSRFRHLVMEAQGNPSDQIPQFSPKTSATYVELALASMFETMDREGVKTIALMATDPRDKLFLAQQIARYSPDVSIFTAESDSLYIHPDYSSYLRGALVVSTYPLYSGNQRWSYGYQGASWGRRQFANGSAQGIYNAALALLAYDVNGSPMVDDPPRLLEYGAPNEACSVHCEPPVWISVVGRSSAWPVRAYVVPDPSDYVFSVSAPASPGVPAVFPSPSFNALLFSLTFAILAGWLAQGLRRTRTAGVAPRRPSLRVGEMGPEGRAYLLVCLTGVLLIQTFVSVLCLIRFKTGDRSASAVLALIAAGAGLLAACHLTARVLAAIVRGDLGAAWRSVSWRRLSTWAVAAAGVVCLWSVWNLSLYLGAFAARNRSDVVSFLTRALDFSDGVSPTVPVLCLGAALSLWGATELARVRRGRVALADSAVHPLLQELVYADVQKLKAPWDLLNQSILHVPTAGIAIAAFAFLTTCLFAFNPFQSWLVTIEGAPFGRFVSAMLLLVQVMLVLALVQFAFLWSRIKELLQFMARHSYADAFERVSRDLFPSSIFPKEPTLSDLQIPVQHWQRLVDARGPEGSSSSGDAAGPPSVNATFQEEMHAAPDTPWAASRTWTALLNAASFTAAQLRTERTAAAGAAVRTTPVSQPAPAGSPAYAATAVVDAAATRLLTEREAELPATLVAFVVRDALARLAQNLIFVIGGVVLVFCSYTLFPFQQHTRLQIVGWIYISITFATILTVLVQIKRNEVVGDLTTKTPGVRTTWDADFVLKVTVFALIPLFTLFAAQFPDLGGTILRWMEPMQRALP